MHGSFDGFLSGTAEQSSSRAYEVPSSRVVSLAFVCGHAAYVSGKQRTVGKETAVGILLSKSKEIRQDELENHHEEFTPCITERRGK